MFFICLTFSGVPAAPIVLGGVISRAPVARLGSPMRCPWAIGHPVGLSDCIGTSPRLNPKVDARKTNLDQEEHSRADSTDHAKPTEVVS